MTNKKANALMILGLFVLIGMIGGLTVAFFNYTRTGSPNTITTGHIEFSSSQELLELSNAFPISTSDAITDTSNTDEAIITISGNTTYSTGVEYLITTEDTHVTIGTGITAKTVPISIAITPEKTGDLGTEANGLTSGDYWQQRGSTTSYYTNLYDGIGDGKKVMAGYIAPGQTGVNGTISIKAFFDKDKIAITDTYSGYSTKTYYEINSPLTQEQLTSCVSYLSGLSATEAFCNGTGTITRYGMTYTFQEALDNSVINTTQRNNLINAGIIREAYTDETTTPNWVKWQRTVLTTSEWNELANTPLSFKVKVEANEGVWIPATFVGIAEFEKTSNSSADVEIISGNIKLVTSVSVEVYEDPETVWGTMTLYKYNSSTNSYDDITNSGEYDKLIIKIPNPNNPGAYFDLVCTYNGSSFVPSRRIDPEFMENVIANAE